MEYTSAETIEILEGLYPGEFAKLGQGCNGSLIPSSLGISSKE